MNATNQNNVLIKVMPCVPWTCVLTTSQKVPRPHHCQKNSNPKFKIYTQNSMHEMEFK